MKNVLWIIIISIQVFLYGQNVSCQNRWVKSYFGNLDTPVSFVMEAYDHGYLLNGWYGHNYPTYLWLIKTDINGDLLWQRTIGDGFHSDVFLDMAKDQSGNILLAGLASESDPQGDPLIIKINPCGEKEWCRIFYTENNTDFSRCITVTPSGESVVILNLTNPDHHIERICLAKLSTDGVLLWKQCYTSADTSQRGEDTYDLIVTPDLGFLVTGFCYYEDPEVPNKWWLHPYFLKVDSSGNFEWETVLYKETSTNGGIANNTVISPNGQFFYSSISHYNNTNNFASPALAKLDMQGNVIGVYDVVTGYYEGKLSYAQFLNDSTLAADAAWGNSADDLWSHAVIIDTLGNLLNSTVLMQDFYTSILDVAYDGKLVYASNTYQNNQFDFYLSKLNQNLEDDTLYTRPFTYDSLCPYQIVSDTILQDDCGLIVGIEEEDKTVRRYDDKIKGLTLYPNPASGVLSVECLGLSEFCDCELMIYDVFGREASVNIIQEVSASAGMQEWGWTIDVSSVPTGIYLAVVKNEKGLLGSAKFIIAR